MQKINYSYEVIIAEDASTDHSRSILEEYQKNAPSNYYFLYREKNLGMFGNVSDLFSRAKGKYVITLEGDDYWIYENKINAQIRFLERHPQYSGCAHKAVIVDAQDRERGMEYPAQKENGDYTLADYLKGKLPGQTASFLYRNYFIRKPLFGYLRQNQRYPLDRFIAFVVVSNGKIACRDCKWSAYRYVPETGSSFSATYDGTDDAVADSVLRYHRSIYAYALMEKKGRKCIQISERLFYKSYLRSWVQSGCKNTRQVLRKLFKARYPLHTFSWILVQVALQYFQSPTEYKKWFSACMGHWNVYEKGCGNEKQTEDFKMEAHGFDNAGVFSK